MSNDDDEAAIFGRLWMAAHINPGPHSVNDRPIIQPIVDQFIAEAKEGGLTQEQLECSLGDIGVFLQRAFDDARGVWKSEFRP